MLTKDDKEKLWDLIEDCRIAMFATWNGESLNSRPMAHTNDKFDGKLYYFTRLSSEKVDELANYPEVNISYADEDNAHYVSLAGTTTITRDQHLIDTMWNPFVAAWFPEGKEGADVALLEVDVNHAEYWDGESSSMISLFKIAKANLTNTIPDMGENKKVG